ncbi:MAG: hypothetical protein HKO54_05205 [Flavobacteriaceae bacterium]|nr:hypothetical protein [Flavobacteriaceae bacterium]
MELFVHDTAFMIAYYRAKYEEESKDPFARLWLRPGLEKWNLEFAKKVSPHDDMQHCMRNRFFYDELEQLCEAQELLLLVNFGAGFSMYPYSLSPHMRTLEVDFEEIVQYKSRKIQEFEENGLLPTRPVQHLVADITKDQDVLRTSIAHYGNCFKVILIEGVFFFLSKKEIDAVISNCASMLDPGDYLMCVSFEDRLKQTPVFDRLTHYFSEVLKSSENPFTTLSHDFYSNLENFQLLRFENGLSLGKKLQLFPDDLDENEVLNEYYYVLQKK